MNILLNINKKYIMPSIVMLKSMEEYLEDEVVDVYIMFEEIPDNELQAYSKNLNSFFNFHFIQVKDVIFNNLLINGHISKEAYYRVFAFKYLPDHIERILYIDADTIINNSLQEFYYQSFDGSLMVACEDKNISHRFTHIYKNLCMDIKDAYFNSGVILFNIKAIKSIENVEYKLMEYININTDKIVFHDQDILNGFFYKRVKFADGRKYNCLVADLLFSKEYRWASKNAAIIHFADKWKPWKYSYMGYFDDLFWKYANQTTYSYLYKEYKNRHFVYRFIPISTMRLCKKMLKVIFKKCFKYSRS